MATNAGLAPVPEMRMTAMPARPVPVAGAKMVSFAADISASLPVRPVLWPQHQPLDR